MADVLAGFGRGGFLVEPAPVRSVPGEAKARSGSGLGRLGYGLGAVYFGFWWAMLALFCRDYQVARLAVESELETVSTAKLMLQYHALQSAQGRLDMAVFWGLVLPLTVLIGLLIARGVSGGLEWQRRAAAKVSWGEPRPPGLPGGENRPVDGFQR